MRTQIQKPDSATKPLQQKSSAANQISMANYLAIQRKEIFQREALEDEEDLLQGKFATVQREEAPNKTGLPDNLKSGIENMSGYSMDDVRVHYNSSKPAQLQALAYTQGTDIHVGPGQEKHLPHEAWHVVQQKQGRVQPTMQLQGVNVNDNEGLEREADVMGENSIRNISITKSILQKKETEGLVQKMAYVGTRSLGAGIGARPDWNIGFGNLKINHSHIIFAGRDLDVNVNAGRPNHNNMGGLDNNIGFHINPDEEGGPFSGPGATFNEEIGGQYREDRLIYSDVDPQAAQKRQFLINSINNTPTPPIYNLFTCNCQDWTDAVVASYNNKLQNLPAGELPVRRNGIMDRFQH